MQESETGAEGEMTYLKEFVYVDSLDVFIEVNSYGGSKRYISFSLLGSILHNVVL